MDHLGKLGLNESQMIVACARGGVKSQNRCLGSGSNLKIADLAENIRGARQKKLICGLIALKLVPHSTKVFSDHYQIAIKFHVRLEHFSA